MMSRSFLAVFAAFLMFHHGLEAGEQCSVDGKAPLCAKSPCEECPDFNGEVWFGYQSDYIFRGLQFADENWIGGVHYTIESCVADLTFGVESIRSLSDLEPAQAVGTAQNGKFERNNFFVSASRDFCGTVVEATYTHRSNEGPVAAFVPPPGGTAPVTNNGDFFAVNDQGEYDTNEFSLAITRCFMGGCATYEATYDLGGEVNFIPEGWYHTLSWNRQIELTKCISLEFTSLIGYYDQQYDSDLTVPGVSGLRGFSHRVTTLEMPVKLGCRFTVTPYVSYVDSLQGGPTHRDHNYEAFLPRRGSFDDFSGLESTSPDDKVFGGVTASLKF